MGEPKPPNPGERPSAAIPAHPIPAGPGAPERQNKRVNPFQASGGYPSDDSFWAAYTSYLEEFLSRQETPPFIDPEMLIEDAQRNRFPTTLDNLAGARGFCLLSGLPGGGKTRLQVWVARKGPVFTSLELRMGLT
ncbi:MAG: hypothetical protein PHQ40_18655 [Anaerolineaceae bacterium]|nr:hypothetical protein [Anaerolineaceae bacterium]